MLMQVKKKKKDFVSLPFLFFYRARGVLFAAAERKSPAARLKPGLPQNLLPRHLVRNPVHPRGREGAPMPLHGFGGPRQDLGVPWLRLGGQWARLRGVPGQVKHQRRVVVGHVLSEALADAGVVAPARSGRGKVRGEKVHLEDRVTWRRTQIQERGLSEERREEAQQSKAVLC